MRKPAIASICLTSAVAVAALAQQQPAEPNANPQPIAKANNRGIPSTNPTKPVLPPAPKLVGEDGNPIAGVKVMKGDVRAVVRGPLAEVVTVLTFRNETDRVLGGELTFPLPEGATIVGYGLDVNGTLVDGVAVEKQQARVVYEKEMNKTVDPGLVEHVVGNNFRTRLYPVPAKGTRTIKVTYVADLIPGEKGKGATLTVPMGLGENLEALDLTVAVEGANEPPTVKGGSYTSKDFQGSPRGFFLRDSLREAKAVDALTISLPEVPATSSSIQKRTRDPITVDELEAANKPGPAAQAFGKDEHFFVLTDSPQRPMVKMQAPLAKNQRILLVWDASLSHGQADKTRELKFLADALARLGNPSVDVALLRNDIETIEQVAPVGADGTAKLIEFLKKVTYDGGTNLGALSIPKNPSEFFTTNGLRGDYDLAMLFSDGLSTIGKELPAKVDLPVYAVASDPSANHVVLRQLCQKSGGVYLNLNRQSDTDALMAVGMPPFSIIKVECDPAKVADVTPGAGTTIAGRVTVAGRLLASEADVTLVYGWGKHEIGRKTFTLKAADATDGLLIPRFWAQQKSAELEQLGDEKKEELVKLGKAFNLVTPNTSLLVLDTADQYVQYGIVPPKTRPEVYKEFSEKIEHRRVEDAKTKEQKVQQVLAMWEARKQWWNAKFDYPAGLKVKPEVAQGGGGGGGLFASNGAVPPASAPQAQDGVAPARPENRPMEQRAQEESRRGDPRPTGEPHPSVPAPFPPATPAPVATTPPPPPGQAAQGGRTAGTSDPHGGANGERADRMRQDLQRATPEPTPVAGGVPNVGTGGDPTRHMMQDTEVDRAGQAGEGRGRVLARWTSLNSDLKDFKEDIAGGPSIQIQPWDPKTPYLAAMKSVAPEKAYDVYLAQRDKYAKAPAFYLDCADYLLRNNQRSAGIRVLTDVVELKLEDARLIRVAAHKLQQIGELDLAISLFEKVQKLRPEEPQSFRDLALALAARADWRAATKSDQHTGDIASDYARALDLLNKVVTSNWDRFPEIEVIALMEANQIAAKLQRTPNLGDVPNPLDSRLRQNLDCDVRIVLTWDADMTDIDLWVTEPSEETCLYSHPRTTIGGAMSKDFTQGYGPEEYLLKKAMPGEYTIRANFYGSRQQELTGACTVQATVITNFGRVDEKRQALTLRLSDQKETQLVGKVVLGNGPATTQPAVELNK